MVIIQHIETSWLKNERGAHAGTLRNKTPTALSLPTNAQLDESTGRALQHVLFRRASPVPDARVERLNSAEIAVGCVRVVSTSAEATVALAWTTGCGGKPVRWQTGREPCWSIQRGQWCQLRYNGRIDIGHTWRYHITTVNVGVFDPVEPDAFLRTEPMYRREDLVRLL